MRYKVYFQKTNEPQDGIPIHHQHLLTQALNGVLSELGSDRDWVTYSTLKGSSKIFQGTVKFLGNKVSFSISSNDPSVAERAAELIRTKKDFEIAGLTLSVESVQAVPQPAFQQVMKYVSISPLVLYPQNGTPELLLPSSPDFSDLIFNSLMERMEKAGYSPEQLDAYQVFGLSPDTEYIDRTLSSQRKISRIYPDLSGKDYVGYLFPFAIHAHPDVQRFIFDCGLGILTNQGYGMIDIVEKQAPRNG